MLLALYICFAGSIGYPGAEAQTEGPLSSEEDIRDPFIPLADAQGMMRKDFKKPLEEKIVQKIKLMGISKVGATFYALLDGELVKAGSMFNGFKVEKIDETKVTLVFNDKQFELIWETEEKK